MDGGGRRGTVPFAKDPDVGPRAGWQPHKSAEDSRKTIRNVLNGEECYAICEKANGTPIGAVELLLRVTEKADECELCYWLGKPYWGRCYVPEAANALLRRAFTVLGMNTVWCSYYEGNRQSARVQEKLGFRFHHTRHNVPVPQMNEIRTCHVNCLTKAEWENRPKTER